MTKRKTQETSKLQKYKPAHRQRRAEEGSVVMACFPLTLWQTLSKINQRSAKMEHTCNIANIFLYLETSYARNTTTAQLARGAFEKDKRDTDTRLPPAVPSSAPRLEEFITCECI